MKNNEYSLLRSSNDIPMTWKSNGEYYLVEKPYWMSDKEWATEKQLMLKDKPSSVEYRFQED